MNQPKEPTPKMFFGFLELAEMVAVNVLTMLDNIVLSFWGAGF
jgi:hypothetical protein